MPLDRLKLCMPREFVTREDRADGTSSTHGQHALRLER